MSAWVCRHCGSESIQEEGSVVEITDLEGLIVADEHGQPEAAADAEGEIVYDAYDLEAFGCRDCGKNAPTLAELVFLDETRNREEVPA